MIRNEILCEQPHEHLHEQHAKTRRNWRKPVLGVLGAVLYIVMALVVMQISFRIWAGMW